MNVTVQIIPHTQCLTTYIYDLKPPICYLPKYQSDQEDASVVVIASAFAPVPLVFVFSVDAADLMYHPNVVGGFFVVVVVFAVSAADVPDLMYHPDVAGVVVLSAVAADVVVEDLVYHPEESVLCFLSDVVVDSTISTSVDFKSEPKTSRSIEFNSELKIFRSIEFSAGIVQLRTSTSS